MDLHAFLINQIEPDTRKTVIFCLFVFSLMLSKANANRQVQLPKVPYEIEFADVTFQLNDATRFLLREEIKKIENDKEALEEQLDYLSLFLPAVRPFLAESAVPDDFKFLVIYNKYQPNTVQSEVLEAGVFWCLSRKQGVDIDLQINSKIDERKHLFISTDGAMISFRRNNVLYNNWGTTLFAQIASRDVINLLGVNRNWNGKRYLVLDSPAYSSLIQFLAFKLVLENELPTYRPKEERVVYQYPYGSQKTLNVIAADLRIDPSSLKKTNQWILGDRVPKNAASVLVLIPSSRFHDIRVLAEISSNTAIPKEELGFPVLVAQPSLAENRGGSFYRINGRKGIKADLCDSYVTLAYKAKLSIKSFLEYNDMRERDITQIGRIYYLEEKSKHGAIKKHITRAGETLWDISMLYGIKLEDLLKYNRLANVQNLQRGRVVWLQEKRPKNSTVEYVEILEKVITEDTLQNDPILGERSSFKWEKEVESEELSTPIISQEKESVIIVHNDEAPIRKEIEVRPLKSESFSQNLKNKVLGIDKEEEVEEIASFVTHTVKKGETLYRISINYKVSVKQLYRLNSLKTNIIEIGDRLKVKPM